MKNISLTAKLLFQFRTPRGTSNGSGNDRGRTESAVLGRTPRSWLTSPTKVAVKPSGKVTNVIFSRVIFLGQIRIRSKAQKMASLLCCMFTRKIPVRARDSGKRLAGSFSINHATHAISLRSESQSLGKSGKERAEFVLESRGKDQMWLVVF